MRKVLVLISSFLFLFFMTAPARALSSAETVGLGSLNIELEYARQFQTPSSQTILAKLVHGLSNQVDIKLNLGSFGIASTGGFVYGGGFKWGLIQETQVRPTVSLNLEFLRGSYNTPDLIGSLVPVKVDSSFFTPSILISKNLIWINPYVEAGYDFADIKVRNVSSGQEVPSLQGSSNTWFLGAGFVLEFDITQLAVEAIYNFDTPLGDSAFKAKVGFNLSL